MRIRFLLAAGLFALSACGSVRLVSPYDEVIDKGAMELSEQLSTHLKNMGDLAGKPAGTYEANLPTYNAIESKLEVLIARASSSSEGKGCKLEKKIESRVALVLQNQIPPEMQSAGSNTAGNSAGCNEALLMRVQPQLALIREIHRTTDRCANASNIQVSCLRPATAKSALALINQSINAVSVVEAAKKGAIE